MRTTFAVRFVILFLGFVSVAHAQAAKETSAIVGTWRLVAYKDIPDKGPVHCPFGEQPEGLLVYGADGYMSIQVMRTPHPKVASGDEEKVTVDEKVALYDAYTAYFGTYKVNTALHVVTTHVLADMADIFVGRDEERPYELQGDRLTLTPEWITDGMRWQGVRVFERVK